jgi:hypothetical protein
LLARRVERGYVTGDDPAGRRLCRRQGCPKSLYESYKWLAIADRWNSPNAVQLLEQVGRELSPQDLEKAKAAAAAYTFKTK